MRRDSEVPLVENGINMSARRNVSQQDLGMGCRRGYNEDDMFKCRCFAEYVYFNHSLIFSCPYVPISPPMSIHTIHAALVRSTDRSFSGIVLASLIYGCEVTGRLDEQIEHV
jgi:hypothetical protein